MVQTPDQAEKDSDAQSWGPAGLETWPSGRESGLPGRWLCGLGAPVAPPPQRHPEPSFCRTVFQRKIKCLLSTYEAPDSIATKIYNTPNDTAYDLFKSFFKFFLNQTKSSKAKPLVKSSIATRRRGQGTSLTCHMGFVCENSNAPATHAGKFLTELLTRKHRTRVIRTWASHIDKETRLIFLKTVLYK